MNFLPTLGPESSPTSAARPHIQSSPQQCEVEPNPETLGSGDSNQKPKILLYEPAS